MTPNFIGTLPLRLALQQPFRQQPQRLRSSAERRQRLECLGVQLVHALLGGADADDRRIGGFGARTVGYLQTDVDAWIQQRVSAGKE